MTPNKCIESARTARPTRKARHRKTARMRRNDRAPSIWSDIQLWRCSAASEEGGLIQVC